MTLTVHGTVTQLFQSSHIIHASLTVLKKSNSKTTVLQSLLILCHGGYRARVTKADQMYLEHGNFLPHEDLTSQ